MIDSVERSPRLTTRIQDLTAALRAHAKGLLCDQAAVELLISHESWLHRDDFVTRFVTAHPGPAPVAFVAWQAAVAALDAGQLPCSSAEGQVLRIAASIAEGIPIDLRHALTGLDAANLRLAARAVGHAGGQREPVAAFAEEQRP